MGYYDLYGQSYPTRREAINAETAQCAEIDVRIMQREIDEMRNQQYEPSQLEYDVNDLRMKVGNLEQRIAELEKLISANPKN